ncbi:unnamed protein product [Kluyveromyces dobzhanskii CBS 2104]|uniref:Guanine nucleotide-binding protein alpha-2 subunit n=1 Tax=Kluyveromyces dobzhanskii CBS 2104 TaxID=1427455 RepID=A0A0A8L6G4_9SACH|nr:unnamed protein product [Kluyveromyces dobzhanskii CBS 2104]
MGLCASKDSHDSSSPDGLGSGPAAGARKQNGSVAGAGEKRTRNSKAGAPHGVSSSNNNSSSAKTKGSTISEDRLELGNSAGNGQQATTKNNARNSNNSNDNKTYNQDSNNKKNSNNGNNAGNTNNSLKPNGLNKRANDDNALANQADPVSNPEGNSEDNSVALTGFSQALALNGSGIRNFDNDTVSNRNGQVSNTMDSAGNTDATNALKVLLLGSGESGKSTVLQQLKILHQNGFSREELLEYKPFIFDNIIETGKDVAKARKTFGVKMEEDSPLTEADLEELVSQQYQPTKFACLPADLAITLKTLWNLPSTQALLSSKHRSSFYLMDSAGYFYQNLDRISEQNYIPTITDVIRARKKTSGIFDTMIDLDKNLKLHFFDVGGQRSERKKWIHCFDNVTLIIFCVSLSEYDQTLLEDNSQNRLEESLTLFDSVVNSRWFARSSVVLFLNKIDIFADKVRSVPLEKYFQDYTGGKDINKAARYILWRFVQLNRANLNIYPHVTQATDTSNIKLVFAAIKETILENSLKDSGVL